jgi:hypothetical protein
LIVVNPGRAEYDEIDKDFEVNNMDDNVWEYPFGDLDDDDEMFYRKPEIPERSSNTELSDSVRLRESCLI